MFIAPSFTIAKIWKQSKCAATNEWIKGYPSVYNKILFSHKIEWNFAFATTWMDMEGIVLSEII